MQSRSKARNRYVAVQRYKNAYATDNDLPILNLLQTYPVLPRHFIDALVPPTSERYRTSRLTTLRHDLGFLRCPDRFFHNLKARSRPLCYENTANAREFLDSRHLLRPRYERNDDEFHRLACCMAIASMDIAVRRRSSLFIEDYAAILSDGRCPQVTRDSEKPFHFPVDFDYRSPKYGEIHRITGHVEHDWPPFRIGY